MFPDAPFPLYLITVVVAILALNPDTGISVNNALLPLFHALRRHGLGGLRVRAYAWREKYAEILDT